MGNGQSTGFEIREALQAELDTAATVISAAYAEYQPRIPAEVWDPYALEIADVRSRLAESVLIVAIQAGRVVGSVTFYPNAGRSEIEGWPSGWSGIRLVAVHPEARGLGIGRLLTEECIERSRLLGVATVGLHTTELMAIARAMYERMGFVRVPEYDFHPGPGITVMAYRLDL